MTYHKIGIQKLSPAQISKFLNGHAITVKHGSHHEIPVSTEQHKKIHSAHKKGKGCRICCDPYQSDMIKSSGIFDHIKSAVKHIYNSNKEHIHKIGKNIAHHGISHIHQHLAEPVHRHLGEYGRRGLSHLAHYAHERVGRGVKSHHAQHRHHGHGDGFFDDLVNVGRQAGDAIIAPVKSVVGVDIPNPFNAGYDVGHDVLGPAIDRMIGGGIKKKHRKPNSKGFKRGGSLTGGALMPAGYGEGRGRRGRRGKGDIGEFIGREIGKAVPWF